MEQIIGLFNTPVYKISIENFSIDDDEVDKIKNNYFYKKNEGNHTYTTSEFGASSILSEDLFAPLKKEIEKNLSNYINNVYCWDSANLKITSSWLNEILSKEEFHHPHTHSNSIISGVFYLKNLQDDKIMFYRKDPIFDGWNIPVYNFNMSNSENWWLPVNKNDLFIFPSHLRHSVPPNFDNDYNKNKRQSISFNTFFCDTDISDNPTTYFGI